MKGMNLLRRLQTIIISAAVAIATLTAAAAPASAYDYSVEYGKERHIEFVTFGSNEVLLFIDNGDLYMTCYNSSDRNNGKILYMQDGGNLTPKSDVSTYRADGYKIKTPDDLFKQKNYLLKSEEGWEKGPIKIMSSVKSICTPENGYMPWNNSGIYKFMEFCVIKNDNSLWYYSAAVPLSTSVTNVKNLKFLKSKVADNISDAVFTGTYIYAITTGKKLVKYGFVHNGKRTTGFEKEQDLLDSVVSFAYNESNVHFAAVKTDNTLWEWGAGCFANGKKSTDGRSSPQQTMKNVKYVSLFTGNIDKATDGGAVIGTDGKTYAWGTKFKYYNFDTGYVYKEYGKTPVCISKSGIARYVNANRTEIYLSTKGTLYLSGANDSAQIAGCGEKYNEKLVKQLTNVSEVAVSNEAWAAIRKDGSVWLCGYNIYKNGDTSTSKPQKIITDLNSKNGFTAKNYFNIKFEWEGFSDAKVYNFKVKNMGNETWTIRGSSTDTVAYAYVNKPGTYTITVTAYGGKHNGETFDVTATTY